MYYESTHQRDGCKVHPALASGVQHVQWPHIHGNMQAVQMTRCTEVREICGLGPVVGTMMVSGGGGNGRAISACIAILLVSFDMSMGGYLRHKGTLLSLPVIGHWWLDLHPTLPLIPFPPDCTSRFPPPCLIVIPHSLSYLSVILGLSHAIPVIVVVLFIIIVPVAIPFPYLHMAPDVGSSSVFVVLGMCEFTKHRLIDPNVNAGGAMQGMGGWHWFLG